MGRRANATTIKVHERVYLKMIGGSYHVYFRIAGKQFRKSTRTNDLAQAKLKALTWSDESKDKLSRGDNVEVISFVRLRRSYLEHVRATGKYRYHAATIERHIAPFFARFDDISKLTRGDIVQYFVFRRSQVSTGTEVSPIVGFQISLVGGLGSCR